MTLVVTSPAPRDAWSAIARADADALLCQAPEWTDAMCARGYADASRLYELAGGRVAVLPLVRRPGPLRSLGSMPDAWGMGGLVATDPLSADDVAEIGADLARLPAARVTVRPNPLHEQRWARAGGLRVPRRAHVLDLHGGPDEVFERRFEPDARRAVRKALRGGVEVRCGAELVADYQDLHALSVARWAEGQNEPVALARLRARRRDPQDKLAQLAERMPDRLRVRVAYVDGRPVAGTVVLLASAASYTRGAMDRARIGGSCANELLHWHAIQEACAAGCTSYHMGESGRSAPLSHFKEKFGARPVEYAERRFERLPLTRADALARSAVKRAIGFRDA